MTGDGIKPNEVINTIRTTVEGSGMFPDKMSYLEKEPDVGGSDSNIKLPILSIQPVSNIRITDFMSDKSDKVTDDAGNVVGRVFTAEYRLDLQLDVWVAAGSSYDEYELGNNLWTVLYEYDSLSMAEPFIGADGNEIESIWKFQVSDGEPANDLTFTPAIRRWRQDVTVWAFHRFDTTESYTTGVNTPGDLSGDGSGQLSG